MNSYLSLPEEDFAKAKIQGEVVRKRGDLILRKYTVEEKEEKKLCRAAGEYYSLCFDKRKLGEERYDRRLAKTLSDILKSKADWSRPFIAGLGNAFITADSLGTRTVDNLSERRDGLYLFKPSVYGLSGLECADILSSIIEKYAPSVVVTVDTLGAIGIEKLCASIQLNTAGITPGEAMGSGRKRLDEKSLGAPVLSLGVPLIAYPETLNDSALWVTPKEIDVVVRLCAAILSQSIRNVISGKRSLL